MNALEMRDVTKNYGQTQALSGLTLQLKRGERVALLGPNGAGKTTAISILLGLRPATAGEVRVLGNDPREVSVRQKLGAMLQETMLPPGLRVGELLEFARSMYPHPLSSAEVARRAALGDLIQSRVERLSGGQRRRVLFAMAIAGNPELLFLDEPTAGIDTETRQNFWHGLQELLGEASGTVLFTTHYLEEAERYATRVVVIRRGRVVAEGTPKELRASANGRVVRFHPMGDQSIDEIRRIAGASSGEISGGTCTILADDPDEAVRRLVRANVAFSQLEVTTGSLEEALTKLSEED